ERPGVRLLPWVAVDVVLRVRCARQLWWLDARERVHRVLGRLRNVVTEQVADLGQDVADVLEYLVLDLREAQLVDVRDQFAVWIDELAELDEPLDIRTERFRQHAAGADRGVDERL